MKAFRLKAFVLWLCAALLGCSGGGNSVDPVQLCNETCAKVAMCSNGVITPAACATQADCPHARPSTCRNADTINYCVINCNDHSTCDNYNACLSSCPACQM
jgi:hypothetical protein